MHMKCVRSKKIYSPQTFVEKLTGKCYGFDEDDTAFEIHNLLRLNGVENEGDHILFDYPLDEIDEIVTNNVPVVLVDTTYINEEYELVHECRWFEVPEDFKEE